MSLEGHEIQTPQGTSHYNMEDGDAIISSLKELQLKRKEYPKIKTIGIITGHKAQEYYLRRKLKAIIIPGVQIGTFDRFQEREYDGLNHTVEFL